ncbi:MAG: fibrobacter succinogenes major paralogous domain-containing protein [Lentimicrobium sp.]|nr:fibrobacter succinogenes major paralogous domain-containing protein [Lentimicrobium sp.]
MKTKNRICFYPLIMMMAMLMLTISCKKDKDDDSNEQSQTSKVPVLTTANVTDVLQTTASCGGIVTSDGGENITARGVCWSRGETPTIADSKTTDGVGVSNFASTLTDLTPNTTYHVRAYATNNKGTGYGELKSFLTLPAGETVTDIDGNVYKTVVIGTQTWMAENLKTTKYRNGDQIPNVTDGTAWGNLSTGAYGNYNNDLNNSTTFGRLYNWYAINDSRNICPVGWHIPTNAEWQILEAFLGGVSAAGGKLKEAGITHWSSPNTGANNESGFTGLPGGIRGVFGSYSNKGDYGYFWTATENSSWYAWNRYLYTFGNEVTISSEDKRSGLSVRCIKD